MAIKKKRKNEKDKNKNNKKQTFIYNSTGKKTRRKKQEKKFKNRNLKKTSLVEYLRHFKNCQKIFFYFLWKYSDLETEKQT